MAKLPESIVTISTFPSALMKKKRCTWDGTVHWEGECCLIAEILKHRIRNDAWKIKRKTSAQ